MYDLKATAIRNGPKIEVLVTGNLADSCHKARVTDTYPGGDIQYIEDPGFAQVFIEESSDTAELCLMILVPWAQTIVIPDDYHDEVQIILNGAVALTVPVESRETKFVVCKTNGSIVTYDIVRDGSCRNVHPFYTVFGPDTYANCQNYLREETGFQGVRQNRDQAAEQV